jgi:Fe2+ transport system protein B
MEAGALRDMLTDGVISGVGSVLVFLPNIMILYLFISFLEDSGYLARAAFIMDKVMHRMGLHGKSFIPMVMGFGCNVPAVMACRTIECRTSRIITIMTVPFMSCSARLPIYMMIVGTFFPEYAGTTLFLLYVGGMLLDISIESGVICSRHIVDCTIRKIFVLAIWVRYKRFFEIALHWLIHNLKFLGLVITALPRKHISIFRFRLQRYYSKLLKLVSI